jgi:Nickel responsive protein SCO4226-like
MALYLIERNFAQELNVSNDGAAKIKEVNAEVGVNWLYSFLSADKKKTYCLYEAPNPELIREAARRNNLPADVIIPVSELQASAFG